MLTDRKYFKANLFSISYQWKRCNYFENKIVIYKQQVLITLNLKVGTTFPVFKKADSEFVGNYTTIACGTCDGRDFPIIRRYILSYWLIEKKQQRLCERIGAVLYKKRFDPICTRPLSHSNPLRISTTCSVFIS